MVDPMASSPRTEAREEERRLNIRTLVIASAASAVAAAVTSQLWFRGTWVAAAVTPVLVTLLSEALHRPTDRLADAARTKSREIRTRGSSVSDRPALEEKPSQPDVPSSQLEIPIPGPGESGPAPVPEPGEADRPASQPPTPVRVYRQPPERPARRKFALGLALTTAALAFVIGVAALTLTELVAGESIGSGGGRTTLGLGSSSKDDSKAGEKDKTDTSEQTEPDQEEDQQTATPAPAPAEEETSTAEQQDTETTTEETATSESKLRSTTPTETSP
jgi:hypothetical protein